MNSVVIFLAGLALALPGNIAGGDTAPDRDVARSTPDKTSYPTELALADPKRHKSLLQRYEPEERDQVRIEQRVVIRVAPASSRARQALIANLQRGEMSTSLQERPMKRCVAMANVAGVQSGPQNRLLLFMRDRRIVSAALEKTCNARDFYSGFYVERTADGLFCPGRDTLQSRTGASCGVRRFAHLVAVKK
jgi:hypothetical protein